MNKENFIPGKWYISSRWNSFEAAKFDKFTSIGDFHYSERINGNKWEDTGSYTNLDKQIWSSFREVSISEIAEYLPKDHPDLQNILPRYVKLLKGFDNEHTGEIFDTNLPIPKYKYWSPKWTWKYLVIDSIIDKKHFIPATKEEYDAQELYNEELKDFPKEGCCLKSQELYDFLCKKYPHINSVSKPRLKTVTYYAWNINSCWSISSSSKPYYTLEQLNKFINNNQNYEVSRITSEDIRRNISGTVAIRCGRQQITTGSRPNGNKTRSSTGRTRFNHVKIIKTTIKREDY